MAGLNLNMNVVTIFGELQVSTILISIFVILLLYWYSIRNHNYWKERNVPFVKPYPFIGSILDMVTKPGLEVELDRYLKYGPIYGHFENNKPMLSVGDPNILRNILVKDTNVFQGNRFTKTGNKELDNTLSMVKGENWERLRTIISPTFSTGKMKRMMGIFQDCCDSLMKNLEKVEESDETFSAKKVFGAFALDVISSSAFSTKLDSQQDPNNKFVQMAAKLSPHGFNWRLVGIILFPRLMKLAGEPFFSSESLSFFSQLTHQIIDERKRTGQTANDFLQLLLDICKEVEINGQLKQTSEEEDDLTANYGGNIEDNQTTFRSPIMRSLTADEMVSQCVQFFLAGYESTSTTLSIACYFLALHPDIQEKTYKQINDVLHHNQDAISYDAVQNMKYLDNVIAETLRLYPPAYRIERMAETDYKLGDTGITISKGTIITIPIYALHRDPRHFLNPCKFDPDRFSQKDRDTLAYIPFGAGPRNCVAMRFALLEMKICLAHLLRRFEVKKCFETKEKLEFHMGQILLQPKDIILKLKLRKGHLN